MPNIKSAKKRVLVNQKKNAQNRAVKSQMKTAIKKFEESVKTGDKSVCEVLFRDAVSVINSAAGKNVIHKNSAARKTARLSKLLNTVK